MKLFMVYVGGACGNSNVEVHDVRFAIGETIEDCHDDLRKQWWGTPSRLHLDCWGSLEYGDGYDIIVAEGETSDTDEKLFIVNLGGYLPEEFTEQHRNLPIVASDGKAAARKALTTVQHWALPHRDNVFDVDGVIDVADVTKLGNHKIVLKKTDSEKPFVFQCDYVPIGEHRDEPL